MLDRMLYLKPALARLMSFENKLGPSGFILSEREWEMIQKLADLLKIFATRTTYLCATRYPTLQAQLPFFTVLLRQLNRFKDEEHDHHVLFTVCSEALEILKNYWQKVDKHSAQSISPILDPRCKMIAFSHLGWKDSWVARAKRHFDRVYQAHYYTPEMATQSQKNISPVSDLESHHDLFTDSFFGPACETPIRHTKVSQLEEITRYLAENTEDRAIDPIQWWKLHTYRFPNLARMARDYMSITATSVPFKQLFSRASDIITKERNRMLESSCNAVLLVKSWLVQEDVDLWELEAESDLEGTGPVSEEIDYEADMVSAYAADINLDEEPDLD
jgi:hypothetical protein